VDKLQDETWAELHELLAGSYEKIPLPADGYLALYRISNKKKRKQRIRFSARKWLLGIKNRNESLFYPKRFAI